MYRVWGEMTMNAKLCGETLKGREETTLNNLPRRRDILSEKVMWSFPVRDKVQWRAAVNMKIDFWVS